MSHTSCCRRTPDLARVLRFSRGVDVWKEPSLGECRVLGHDHCNDQYIFILNCLRISVINIVSY